MSARNQCSLARTLACPRPRPSREQSTDSICPCPRTVPVRVQSADTGTVTTRTHPRTCPSFNSPGTGLGRGHKPSANSPHPRIVHVLNLAALADARRPDNGQRTTLPPSPCVRGPRDDCLPSYPHHSCSCPPLIQPQSARRSRTLRLAVRRNSTTCFRRRNSSQSCARSGHPSRRVAENRRRCFRRLLRLFLTIRPCVFSTLVLRLR